MGVISLGPTLCTGHCMTQSIVTAMCRYRVRPSLELCRSGADPIGALASISNTVCPGRLARSFLVPTV